MHDGAGVPEDVESVAAIPDVNHVPLKDLFGGDDSVLSGSLRRLVMDLERPVENYAAHSSST